MEPRRAGRPADYTGLDGETVRSLEFLGLSAYEIKVYLAVLQHPRSRVPDIARLARVPQPKVYSTVKRLIGRGLIESELGPVNRYSSLDPQHAFRPLLEDVEAREESARTVIKHLRDDFASAADRDPGIEGRVKLFQSRPAAARSFRDRITRVSNYLGVIVRWPLVIVDYAGEIEQATQNGVEVQMLCEVRGELTEAHTGFVERMREAGAKMRRIPETPMRMAVFDEEAVVLPMNDPAPLEGDGFMMLEVRNHDLSRGFRGFFDHLWREAEEF
jgi:sugar-specific transcriptional regulator TrmB